MVCRQGVGKSMVRCTVVCGGVALGEVVGLNLLGVATNPLPINLKIFFNALAAAKRHSEFKGLYYLVEGVGL